MLAKLAAVTAFLAILAGTLALERRISEKRSIRQRLERYVLSGPPGPALPGQRREREKQGVRVWGLFRWLGKFFNAPSYLEARLIQAGVPLKGGEFLAFCSTAAVVLGAGLALAGSSLYIAAAGGILAFFLPFRVLRYLALRRARTFESQLGDALLLAANSLRTGYSFLQAMEMVAREMPPPIAAEFARALRETHLGATTEEALNNMAERIRSKDFDIVVTSVLIQRQVGGNLAEVLDNISGTIRERVKIRGEIRTLTAQGRISGIVVGAMPVFLALALYWLNPEYISVLFTEPAGRLMLAGAIASQLIGAAIIRRIVNIEL